MSSENENLVTFKATADSIGVPTQVVITDKPWALQIDESEDDGGNNSGPNPMHHLIAGLAGCLNEQTRHIADELELTLGRIDFTLEIDLDLSGFIGEADSSDGSYKQVRFFAIVRGDGVSDAQVRDLGRRVDARCPIISLLRTARVDIQSSWTLR